MKTTSVDGYNTTEKPPEDPKTWDVWYRKHFICLQFDGFLDPIGAAARAREAGMIGPVKVTHTTSLPGNKLWLHAE